MTVLNSFASSLLLTLIEIGPHPLRSKKGQLNVLFASDAF